MSGLGPREMEFVAQAQAFAAAAHAGQKYGDEPYTVHTDAVVAVLEEYNFDADPEMLAAGHLHDVPEDCPGVTLEAIRGQYGERVASLVYGVTNEPGANRRERAAATYPKIREHPDRIALKLADRIANTRHAKATNPQLFKMYQNEYPGFRAALRQPDMWGGMWGELDSLMEWEAAPERAGGEGA